MEQIQLKVVIEEESLRDGSKVYAANCEELDIASQGSTVEEARENISEAVTLWLESASVQEVESKLAEVHRRKTKQFITQIEVAYGPFANAVGG